MALPNGLATPHLNGISTNSQAHPPKKSASASGSSGIANDPTYPALRHPSPSPRVDFTFDRMEDALEAFKRGEFLVVMDDESRENEGDLILAAEHCTTEKLAWMIKHTRCAALNPSLSGENIDEA